MVPEDFPVVTVCNNNLISRTKKRLNPNKTIHTFEGAMEVSEQTLLVAPQ